MGGAWTKDSEQFDIHMEVSVGGTLINENISRASGANHGQETTDSELFESDEPPEETATVIGPLSNIDGKIKSHMSGLATTLTNIFFCLASLAIFSFSFSLIILTRSLIVKWNVVSLLNKTSQIFNLCLVGLRLDDLNLSVNSAFFIMLFITILN